MDEIDLWMAEHNKEVDNSDPEIDETSLAEEDKLPSEGGIIWTSPEKPKIQIIDQNPVLAQNNDLIEEGGNLTEEEPKGDTFFERKSHPDWIGHCVISTWRWTGKQPGNSDMPTKEGKVCLGFVNEQGFEQYYLGNLRWMDATYLSLIYTDGGFEFSPADLVEDLNLDDAVTKKQILDSLNLMSGEIREKVSAILIKDLQKV